MQQKKPHWLKIHLPKGEKFFETQQIVKENHLHTICTSGKCPNIAECWGRGTATFMILGDICTRNCRFCATKTGIPNVIDENEPLNVANSVKLMKLNHCVLTSVTRDDLKDGGAEHWANVIFEVKKLNPTTTLETLIPDFLGNIESLRTVFAAKPEIISHNIETVKRLTSTIRSNSDYSRSLKVLSEVSKANITAKSGIMVGLGETENEVFEAMDDLLNVGCEILTIGQYLQPTKENIPVSEFVTPEQFEKYKHLGLQKGFRFVESGPLVRSSFYAEKHSQKQG